MKIICTTTILFRDCLSAKKKCHFLANTAFARLALVAIISGTPPLSAQGIGAPASSEASNSAVDLNPITVYGGYEENLRSASDKIAVDQTKRWPGNVSIVGETILADESATGLSDVLERTPGILATTSAGQLSGKISIRGSGLASPLGVRGITLLRDGLPLNQADGVVDPFYVDPFNARYIEIYRGSNAIQYGAATLGGAINLVSPTGYSHPGVETRLLFGSNETFQAQTRAGKIFDEFADAFVSATDSRTDGTAANSSQKARRFYGNLGLRFTPYSEGRIHLDIANLDQDVVSPLTLEQLTDDKANPRPRWPDQRIKTNLHNRIGYQHTYIFEGGDRLSIGAYYLGTDFDLTGTVVPIYFTSSDTGLSIRNEVSRIIVGRENNLSWGVSLAQGQNNSQTTGPFLLPGGSILDPSRGQYEAIKASAQTASLYFENHYFVTSAVSIVVAMQAVAAKRERNIEALRQPRGLPNYFKDLGFKERYNGLNPKFGAIWQLSRNTQIYSNLSRSYEPPTTIELYNADGATSAQRAKTFEIGSRGTSNILHWEASVFHSRVKDELLNVPKFNGFGEAVGYQGGNIPRTVHSGFELRLDGNLFPARFRDALEWEINYTFNQFRHDQDSEFGNNRLPVVPKHYGNVRATYRHPAGLYLGPSLEFGSSTYADQANTLKAPGYGILNFAMGYVHPSGRYRLFLSARNIADKHYAASTQFLARASSNEAAFNPGLSRSLFAGAEISW